MSDRGDNFGGLPVLDSDGINTAKAQQRMMLAQANAAEETARLQVQQGKAQLEQLEFARKNTLTKGETVRFEAVRLVAELVKDGKVAPGDALVYADNMACYVTNPDGKPRVLPSQASGRQQD